MVKIKFLAFAMIREIIGEKETVLELPNGSTIKDLVTTLVKQWPRLKKHVMNEQDELDNHFTVVVNENVIQDDEIKSVILKEGDVVALIPPIAGG